MLTRRSFVGLVAGFSAGMLPALAANNKKELAANKNESDFATIVEQIADPEKKSAFTI